MGKRQREWAKRTRAKLIEELGGVCVMCGTTEKLVLDHINGRDWEIKEKDQSWRVSIYKREAKERKLQVLCDPCNVRKGHDER